ncbi:membrane protein [Sulfurospirillum diekertiae]|uniref:Membrane protein n=2 Tax=Sulfurospirillum diekertiae TaxID=1854492 RepID=A0A1Y0HJA3_9BACT|nr:membrane protein [Sulfurospirillum diekertiae]ASC92981.1 membrane protein [Sulfurospirillum diekertiae]
MHLNSHLMLTLFITLCVTIMAQLLYFSTAQGLTPSMITCKKELVALVGLPDLALVSEAHYVRHRSLSDVFSYFNESPELLEYFPSTFVYHYAPNAQPSRIERVF